jgi:FkbM family methyltransferase
MLTFDAGSEGSRREVCMKLSALPLVRAAYGLVRRCVKPLVVNPLIFDEIRSLVGRDDPIILEIGANDGTQSRCFLDTFPRCRLFCFEPDSRAIWHWKKNVQDPRATLIESAVGAVDGTVIFYVSAGREPVGWDKSGSIRAPKTHLTRWPWVTFPTTVEVACTRLDTWLDSEAVDRIDFIWADVQGAEGDLAAGAPRALAMTRYFYTEYSNEELYEGQIDLRTLTERLADFEIAMLFRSDVLFRRRASAPAHQEDARI